MIEPTAKPSSGAGAAEPHRASAEQQLHGLFLKFTRISGLACAFYVVVMFAMTGEPLRLVAPIALMIGGVACELVGRHFGQRNGFVAYLWGFWAAVVAQSIVRQGVTNPITHGFMVLVLMAVWLVGIRHAVALLVASIGFVGFLQVGNAGMGFFPGQEGKPPNYLVALAVIWSVGLLISRQVWSLYQQREAEAQALNTSLRVQAQDLTALEARTREQAQRTLALLEATPLPITVTDPDSGVFIEVNPAWEQMSGWQRAEVLGRSPDALDLWAVPAQRKLFLEQMHQPAPVNGFEAVLRLRDGSERSFLLHARPFVYGEARCILSVAADITERQRLSDALKSLNASLELRVAQRTAELDQSNGELRRTLEQLNQTRTELVQQEKLAALGNLVAGVAHEMNTPLGNAGMATSCMLDDMRTVEDALANGNLTRSGFAQFLQRMRDGTELAQRSVNQASQMVASFKQVATNQTSEVRCVFDLHSTVSDVTDTLRPAMQRAGHQLYCQSAPGVQLDSYPGPLQQVLIQLVDNAMRHGLSTQSDGWVRIEVRPAHADSVQISVCDNGMGIAQEHIDRVFEPFFTTRFGQGGSGLGLPVARNLVTRVLGGSLQVESQPGQGCRFVLTVPTTAP